jgi:Bor protein
LESTKLNNMKKLTLALTMVVILFSSCYTLTHTVGSGGSGGEEIKKRAWYILFGLVPLNTVESKAMAGNATNYTVTSSHTVVDVLLNIITGIVTVGSQTVTVQK